MSKHNVVVECACNDGCGRVMTVLEDEGKTSLTILQVKTPNEFIPEFFELNHDTALELVKFLSAKYKFR